MRLHWKETAQAYVDVFNGPSGRILLFDLMKIGGVFSAQMQRTPEEAAYALGRKALVLDILAKARVTDRQILAIAMEEEETDAGT